MALEGQLEIRIKKAPKGMEVLKAIRGVTQHSMGDINAAIKNQTPLHVGRLFHSEHEETRRIAFKLFRELDKTGAEFDVVLDGKPETVEYVKNVIKSF